MKNRLVVEQLGRVFEIEQYHGSHANEYCIYELKDGVRNGTAELFEDGIVSVRWKMKNGVRDGSFILFDRGLAVKKGEWSDFCITEEKVVESRQYRSVMVIRICGEVIYEGGFNESMQRNGLGYEYEEGVLKRYGKWEKDELVELTQFFVSDNEMIEYANGATSDLLSHRPIYIGGYQLDEQSGLMKRNGCGRVLNRDTSVCEYESEWNNGTEIASKRIPLFNGLNKQCVHEDFKQNIELFSPSQRSYPSCEGDLGESTRHIVDSLLACSNTTRMVESDSFSKESLALNTLLSSYECIEELTLADQSLNDDHVKSVIIENVDHLKSLHIGKESFSMVRHLIINGLRALESLQIDDGSFTLTNTGLTLKQSSGSCFITNCPRLRSVEIGSFCFSDYWFLELTDLPSLETLLLKNDTFVWTRRFSLKSSGDEVVSLIRSSSSPVAEAVEVRFSPLSLCCV